MADAGIIRTFQNKFSKLKSQQIFSAFKLISNNFLGEKYMSKKIQRKKPKPRPKLLKTLNINQF